MNAGLMVLDVPLLMLGAGVIGAIAWSRNGNAVSTLGRASPVGAKLVLVAAALGLWLLLTATSMWLAFIYGFLACHFLLWGLGRLAAGLGLILVAVVIVSIPFVWGWALLKTTVRH